MIDLTVQKVVQDYAATGAAPVSVLEEETVGRIFSS